MKCSKCGTEINKNANFCRVCGSSLEVDLQKVKDNTSSEDLKKVEGVVETNVENISDTSELFFGKTNSSKKIKQILDEMTPEEKNPDEPTMAIPSELIKKYCKKKDNKKEESSTTTDKKIEKETPKKDKIEEEKKVQESVKEEIVSKEDKKEDKKEESSTNNTSENIVNNDISEKEEIKEEAIKKEEVVEEVKEEKKEEPKIEEKKEDTKVEKVNEVKELFNDNKIIEKTEKIDENNKEEDEEDKDNNKIHYGKGFFTFFVIMICLCAIGYLVYVLYSSRGEFDKIDKENASLKEQINILKSGDKTASSDGILFNGYRFSSIGNNVSIVNNSLIFNIEKDNFVIKISNNIDYEELKNNKDEYKNKLISEGYTVLSYGNKHVDERDYYVFEVMDSNKKKCLIAYTTLDKTDVIAFIISNSSNTIDYNLLMKTNLIISSNKEVESVMAKYDVFVEKR